MAPGDDRHDDPVHDDPVHDDPVHDDPVHDDPVHDDPVHDDPAVLESAMDTGSDVGEPGDRADEGPLTGDERALLSRLTDTPRFRDAPGT